MQNIWLQVWGQSHTRLSLFYYPKKERTYRLIVNTAVSGEKIRIGLSNAYGKKAVTIKRITAAKCDKFGNINCDGDIKICKYSDDEGFVMKAGEKVILDETDLDIPSDSYFCVSVCVLKGRLDSGNLMNNALLLTSDGDKTDELYMKNKVRPRDSVMATAANIMRLPLHKPIPLFESIELLSRENASSVVVFGDSLSQQGYWTNAFEKRLRENFGNRYTLINKSLMGNRVLKDCSPKFILRGLYGKNAVARMNDDIFEYDNISHCILFIGINDIIQFGTPDAFFWEKPDLNQLCAAISGMAAALRSKGIKVMVFTIPAFGKSINGSKKKDEMRKAVNLWLNKNSDLFDAVFDVAKLLEDPENSYYTADKFLGPDSLHIDGFGGEAIANGIDLTFFE